MLLFLAVVMSIPATVRVVVPENHLKLAQEIVFLFTLVGIVCSALFVGPSFEAVLEVPYVGRSVSAGALGAAAGAFLMMSIAAAIRLFRDRQGKDGAAMLFAGILAAMVAGIFWIWVEPMCWRADPEKAWPGSCPVNEGFDHDSIVVLCLLL